MKMLKNGVVIGGIFGFLAVVLGAFGTHGLKVILSANQYESFETGIRFQFFHGIVILVLALYQLLAKTTIFKGAIRTMTLGTLLFSFSIYILAVKSLIGFESIPYLWIVTPIGGTLLIISWLMVTWEGVKMARKG